MTLLIALNLTSNLFMKRSRVIFHFQKVCSERRALIQSPDTDAPNCTELFKELTAQFCKALPVLNVFTGCDYNASF